MREEASSCSRVVSEALYGERVVLQETRSSWSFIQTSDGYQGWIDRPDALYARETPITTPFSLRVCRKAAHLYHVKDTEWGAIKTLPFGSPLQALDQEDERWVKVVLLDGQACYIHKGDVTADFSLKHKRELVPLAKQFLDLPYTWGGRSSFGFDCSGFVQMLYLHLGILLPRDSFCQVKDERFQDVPLDRLEPGDLIFFGRSSTEIRHVGMAMGDFHFIHTSPLEQMPFLRISSLAAAPWNGDPDGRCPYRIGRQY